jgi:hypothetical protein
MSNDVKQVGEKAVGDMYLAAAMLAYGANLKRVDRTDQRRQKFIFQQAVLPSIIISNDDVIVSTFAQATLDDIETYFIGKRLWLPPSYSDSVKGIKSAIHSES